MRSLLFAGAATALSALACDSTKSTGEVVTMESPESNSLIDHQVKRIDGSSTTLADYRGKALLIVNTASECGFTPQYAGLQELYEKYQSRGFEVLGFPSNDFGGQEPGTCEAIQQFITDEYQVTFPMFDKVHAKGSDIAPLYKTLTQETPEGIRGAVRWNFTKFLVDPKGHVVARFESSVKPGSNEIRDALESVLP